MFVKSVKFGVLDMTMPRAVAQGGAGVGCCAAEKHIPLLGWHCEIPTLTGTKFPIQYIVTPDGVRWLLYHVVDKGVDLSGFLFRYPGKYRSTMPGF